MYIYVEKLFLDVKDGLMDLYLVSMNWLICFKFINWFVISLINLFFMQSDVNRFVVF